MRLAVGFALAFVACASPATSAGPSSSLPASTRPTPVAAASPPDAMTVTGSVTWNHHAQSGVRVEVGELGAPGRGAALGSATTSADGSFVVTFTPPTYPPSVGAFATAHDGFLEIGRPARGVDATTLLAGTIEIRRIVTGLSVKDGDQFSAGALTITWDAVPEATSYCANVWRIEVGAIGGGCPEFAHAAGEIVTAPRYTTAPLAPGKYAVSVLALTDTVIGELDYRPRGIAFIVR